MRSVFRVLIPGLVVALFAVLLRSDTSRASAALLRAGFGGAVLVGDGEVFAGEAANSFRPGMVYVYRKTNGAWREAATLKRPDAAVGDQFGSSLELEGSTLFVGAGNSAVHVFRKEGSDWRHVSFVSATDVRGDSVRFGRAIAASGEWLMVGKAAAGGGRGGRGGGGGGGGGGRAAGPAPANEPAGAVYIFHRGNDGRYSYFSTLMSSDAANAGDAFGVAIDVSGTTALIGANGQASRAGVVHEFSLDSTGAWRPVATFASVGLAANDAFGSGVLLSGSQALVTAPGDGAGYGALYVFRKTAGGGGRGGGRAGGGGGGGGGGGRGGRGGGANATWTEVLRLSVPAGNRQEAFGASIAADAREVWAGATGARGTGGVYVFAGDVPNATFDDIHFVAPSNLPAGAQAGGAISIRGNVAAVGAASATRSGALLIFERDVSGVWREQNIIFPTIDEIAPVTGGERRCGTDGKADVFNCADAELLSFLPPSRLTHDGHYIELSGIWGWTDPRTNKEYALVGRRDGTSFVDISSPANPKLIADMPMPDGARANSWKEIKVYKDHAYVVGDGAGPHGMQIFDLTRLRRLADSAPLVKPDTIYREINSAHNIVINEQSGFGYSVGTSGGGDKTCGGGLHMMDLRQPKSPKFVGCFADVGTGRSGTGYTHDAQCVTYRGPDRTYRNHEICVASNETAISIQDVTDKSKPKMISRLEYPNRGYTHQGWFTEDMRYFYVNDETDEGPAVPKTRTLILDLADLDNPKLAKEHFGVEAASDHNLYIKGNLMYQANYRSGLRVLDISDPLNPREVSYFDSAPYTNNGPGFNGAWSVYPFFKSGTLIISSIEQGLVVVKKRGIVF